MKNNKLTIQIIIVALIIGAIVYIEVNKPHNSAGQAISLSITSTSSTTASSTSATSSTSISTSTQASLAVLTTLAAVDQAAGDPQAKEITDPTGFINSPNGNTNTAGLPGVGDNIGNAPFTLSQFVGNKVILLDFWTYSCINCERTIPYLNAWYEKYKDAGLIIVGVHSPEFAFEKNYANVAAAVKQYGIAYPVVLDSNMGTWDAYQNIYWPAEYLIDAAGYVVHTNFGEGDYDVTEKAIQSALIARDKAFGMSAEAAQAAVPTGIVNPSNAVSMDPTEVQSPETYFGAERNEYLANGNQGVVGEQTLTAPTVTPQAGQTTTVPPSLKPNALYLGGTWNVEPQYAETVGNGSGAENKIVYDYNAKNVYMVAAATSSPVKIDIILDGVPQGSMTIKADQLYPIIQGQSYGEHVLEIDVEGAGLDAYTFTFG
jgi:thiol-disulfide isomerase/thioredoxin